MGQSWQIGVVRNIPLRIHWTFVILPLFYGLGAGSVSGAIRAVIFILLLFACVALHELGHALAAQRYQIAVREILLLPIGGLARLAQFPRNPAQELVIAGAGPVVNILIALLLGLVLLAISPQTLGTVVSPQLPIFDVGLGLVVDLAKMNIFLALFNLIPAFPMDGGRVLRALLGFAVPFEDATRVATWVGRVTAGGLALFGVISGNLVLAVIAIFVFTGAGAEYQMVRQQAILEKLKVRDVQRPVYSLHPLDLLGRIAPLTLNGGQPLYPIMDGGQLEGVVTPQQIAVNLERLGPSAPVSSIAQAPTLVATPGMSLNDLYDEMAERKAVAVLVMDAGRPVGVVTAVDVMRVLREGL